MEACAGAQPALHDPQFEAELRDARGRLAAVARQVFEHRREGAQHARELRFAGALGRERVDPVLREDGFDETRALLGLCVVEIGELLLGAREMPFQAALISGRIDPCRGLRGFGVISAI